MASVSIKDLYVDMDIKTRGVEFEIRDSNGKHLGDLVVNKKGLIWCKGKTNPKNGIEVNWNRFIDWMQEED